MKQDLLFASRQIMKKPGFPVMAIAILALGIGSSVAVFSVLYGAVLKPPLYPQPLQLVFIHNVFPRQQVAVAGVSSFDYAEVKRHKNTFASAGVFYYNDLTLTGMGAARHIDAVNASAALFDVLGVKPQLGRAFSQEEDQQGAPKTLLLSDAFWRSAFGASPSVLGRGVRLNGALYTVIGVMPRNFQFPSAETQIWIPIALRPAEFTIEGGRLEKWLHMVARLAPGVSRQRADAALEAIGSGLASRFPMFYPAAAGWHFAARPLIEEQTQAFRRWLYLAFGAVLSVLLIACINVSGLLLIRTTVRHNELAVRMAMGAGTYRIVRLMLAETLVLVATSAVLGLVFGVWAVDLTNRYGPLAQTAALQGSTLLCAVALVLLSTVCAGLLPALLSARLPLEQALKGGATRTATRGAGWQNAIVAAQIALAVTLVFAATELSRSFLNLTRVPAGFEQEHVWSGAVDLPGRSYAADQSWNTRFFEPLLAQLSSIPGVESASGSNALPFKPSGVWTEELHLPGRFQTHPPPEAQIAVAFPGYFKTMGIPLLHGREFTPQDRVGALRVAVIDEELARRYFPGQEPIGKLIASGGAVPASIIGVVGSVHNSDLGGPREPQVYYPELQERSDSMYLVLRTRDVDPTAAVRDAIAKLDPAVALYDVRTMEQRVDASLRLRRFIAFLLSGFAFMGVLLAAVGLYASLAHLVELRRREIGIRVALGALQSQIVRMILSRGGIIAAIGLAAGVGGAFLVGRAIRSELFGVPVADPATWVAVLIVYLAAAALAIWVPAQRAAQIEPSLALREE